MNQELPPDDPQPSSSNPSKPSPPGSEGDKKDKGVGWIEGLAKRSAGLPDLDPATKQSPPDKSAWNYVGLGVQFAGTALVFAIIGIFLDHRYGWSPWGTVTSTMLGVIGGLYLLIKEALKEDQDGGPQNRDRPGK